MVNILQTFPYNNIISMKYLLVCFSTFTFLKFVYQLPILNFRPPRPRNWKRKFRFRSQKICKQPTTSSKCHYKYNKGWPRKKKTHSQNLKAENWSLLKHRRTPDPYENTNSEPQSILKHFEIIHAKVIITYDSFCK